MLPSNSRCPLSIEVTEDKCKAAGLAVGGVLQNDGVVEGSWDNKPNGCFFQPEIHYNDLPRIQIKSAGYNVGNYASIKVDEIENLEPAKRGLNVVVMSDNGSIISVKTFDTHFFQTDSNEFTQFLSGLENGVLVLISIKDEAQSSLTSNAKQALKDQLGSTMIDSLGYRDSWCIIGRKGNIIAIVEDHQVSSEASCNYMFRNLDSLWHPICNKMEVRFLMLSLIFSKNNQLSHYETVCFL